ncbi:uncharacterized protein HaLaN_15417, partial [Haematococcus lacustris]
MISEEELHTTSCIMGYGAVKYADLKNYRMTNYKFRLTDYLYELSEKFNQFYTECKVLGSENEAERLILVEATARIMRQ